MLAAGVARAGDSPLAFILSQPSLSKLAHASAKRVGRANFGGSIVDEAAHRLGVPVNIARAIVRIESGGNCRAQSISGAVGIMQTLPATARAMGVTGDLKRCEIGLEAGMRYLSRIIAAHGTGCGALSLYNMGEAARPVCTSYGLKVLAFAR